MSPAVSRSTFSSSAQRFDAHTETFHESLERLLDSAEALIATQGFEATTVAEIARRADSSVTAFYRRFRDKGALLHALHERYTGEAWRNVNVVTEPERWRGTSLANLIHALVALLVQMDGHHTGLRRAVAQRAASDIALRDRTHGVRVHINDQFTTELVLERRDEIQHPHPELAAPLALHQAMGVLYRRGDLEEPERSILRPSDDEIRSEIARACLAYLRGGGGGLT